MKDYETLRNPKETMEFFIEDVFEIGYKQGYEDEKADTPFTDTEEAEKKAYQRGFEDGQKEKPQVIYEMKVEEYNKGLNEAWECARKMFLMSSEERLRAFDVSGNHLAILSDLTAPKAIAKLKAFEQKQKCKECKKTKDPIFYGYCNGKCDYGEKQTEDIKVGDEVTHDGATFIVLNIDSPTSVYCLDTRGRTPIFTNIHNLTKTGRHFDEIKNVLDQMREK